MKNKNKEKYNPEFVKKVLESRKQAKEGKVTRVEKENLKELFEIDYLDSILEKTI